MCANFIPSSDEDNTYKILSKNVLKAQEIAWTQIPAVPTVPNDMDAHSFYSCCITFSLYMNDGLIGSFTWPFDWGRKILSLFYRWFWGRSSGEGNGYHPVFLPRKFQKQRCPVGYSPCGPKELDSTEWLTLSLSHFHVICRYNPKENSNTTPRRALKNCRGRKSTKKSIVPLFLEKGMIQCINLCNLWTSANVWLDGQDFKGICLENWLLEGLRKRYMGDHSK